MASTELDVRNSGLVLAANLFTLKVIFFDILVALGDVISDYAQVSALRLVHVTDLYE